MTVSSSRDRALDVAKASAVVGWGAVLVLLLAWGLGRAMPSPAPAPATVPAAAESDGFYPLSGIYQSLSTASDLIDEARSRLRNRENHDAG